MRKIGIFTTPCICFAEHPNYASRFSSVILALSISENKSIMKYDGIEYRSYENIPLENVYYYDQKEDKYYFLRQIIEQTWDDPEDISEGDLVFHGTSWENAQKIVEDGFLRCGYNDNSIDKRSIV